MLALILYSFYERRTFSLLGLAATDEAIDLVGLGGVDEDAKDTGVCGRDGTSSAGAVGVVCSGMTKGVVEVYDIRCSWRTASQ